MTKTTKWLDLLINGKSRKAEAMKENDLYVVIVPAAELVDGSGTGEQSPAVQGHRAVFDKDGVLLGVDALGWNAEGGFYGTNWPTKADSLYNANAAKTYAPQVFKQVKKNGGWLQADKNGGITQEQEQMLLLLALVDAAYGELQQEKPGRSLQYLLQLMLDPKGAQMLEVLKTQVPEVQDVLDHIEQASLTSTFKKGGCVKSKVSKKVKKGAKGCVPCKRLMKIGGKLVNVLTDCEGNIISRHQAGGWLIPKGEDGLTATLRAMLNTSHDLNWAKNLAASATTKTGKVGVHYYLGDDGKTLYMAGANLGLDGNYFWKSRNLGDITTMTADDLQTYGIAKNGNAYTTGGTRNTDGVFTAGTLTLGNLTSLGNAYDETTTGAALQQYYDGTDWYNMKSVQDAAGNWVWKKGNKAVLSDFNDDDMRTGLTKADLNAGTITKDLATAAGIDASKFATEALSVHGVSGTAGNSLYGTLSGPTVQLYINHHGGWLNAMQAEDDVLKAKRRAAYEHARLSRLSMRRQMRALDGVANLTINGESKPFTSRADARQAIRQDRRSYMDEARQARATNQAAILSTLAPQRTTVPKANLTVSTGTAATPSNSTTELRPANQTLTLRFGGRLPQFKAGGYIQKYGLGDLLNPINPYPNASLNGNFIRDIITAAKNDKLEEPAPAVEQKATADKNTKPSNIRAFTFYSKLGRDKVKEIQTNLKKLGYDVEVNGLINDRLVNAVKAFLKSTGAKVDGMAGTTTLGKMAEAINWKKPESVDLTTKVNPQWAALPSESQSDTFDPSKGMISDSRTVDGFTEYLVGDVWVDADALTSDQINKYKKGLGTLTVFNKNGGWLNKFK